MKKSFQYGLGAALLGVIPNMAFADLKEISLVNQKLVVKYCQSSPGRSMKEGTKVLLAVGADSASATVLGNKGASSSWGINGSDICVSIESQLSDLGNKRIFLKDMKTNAVIEELTLAKKTVEAPKVLQNSIMVNIDKSADESKAIQVSFCHSSLKVGQTVFFRLGEGGVEQSETVNANKCVVKTYSSKIFAEGKTVFVRADGYEDLKAVVRNGTVVSVANLTVAKAATASQAQKPVTPPSNSNSGMGAGSSSQQQQPVDNRREYSDADIERTAEISAQRYVESVVQNIGQAEMLRNSFFKGVQDAKRISRLADIRSTNEYREGRASEGSNRGRNEGAERGAYVAQSRAAQMAKSDVEQRIDAAIQANRNGGNVQPEFLQRESLDDQIRAYQGESSSNRQQVTSIESLIDASDRDIRNQFRSQFRGDDDVVITEDFYKYRLTYKDLLSIDDYRSELVEKTYYGRTQNGKTRGENAFEGWMNGDLRPRKDQSNKNFYVNIGDSTVSKNASENDRRFRRAFMNRYEQLIDEAWRQKVSQVDERLRELGQDKYLEAFRRNAFEQGAYDQYQENFSQAAQEAFQRSLKANYEKAFAQAVKQVQTGAMISGVSAHLEGPKEATLGDTFTVVVDRATNRGTMAGEAAITVRGLKQLKEVTVSVPAYGSLQKVVREKDAAMIVDVQQPDQVLEVSVAGNHQRIEITFEALIKKLSATQNSDEAKILLSKLTSWIAAEWEQKSGMGGGAYPTADSKEKAYLVQRLADLAKSDIQVSQGLKRYKKEIHHSINEGEKPGMMSWVKRGDYNKVIELLEKANIID